jgi:hypothetical protein
MTLVLIKISITTTSAAPRIHRPCHLPRQKLNLLDVTKNFAHVDGMSESISTMRGIKTLFYQSRSSRNQNNA